MGDPRDQIREILRWAADSVWVHQFWLVLLLAAICWVPARIFARRWLALDPEQRTELRLMRRAAHASVWPLLSLVVATIALQFGQSLWPDYFGARDQILAVLGFFLGFRILDGVLQELNPDRRGRRGMRRGLLVALFAVVALHQLGWLGPVMEFLQRPILTTSSTTITSLSVLTALGALFLMVALSNLAQRHLGQRVLPRLGVDFTLAEALGTVVRYLLVVLGVFWALDLIGFNLSTIAIGLGALGVGIGMGLQGMVNNFVSGLILMFEGSIKRGDVLTVASTDGRVKRIGLRASVIRSREGEDLIMPNSTFTDNTITNYSFGDDLKLVDVHVGVSYDADPHEVRDILLEVAAAEKMTIEHPAPLVRFREFGASSLDFELRVWIRDPWAVPAVRSDLLFAIWYALKKRGIEIPFPQRDLHIRTGELPVRLRKDESGG
jgi:small-conductance mechanosensitive channel